MILSIFICFGTVVSVIITVATASTLWEHGDFLRARSLSSIVIGDYLYLDGGDVSFSGGGAFLASTLRISLRSGWSTSNVTGEFADKPTQYPFSRFPTIWTDGSNLYSAGGQRYYYKSCGNAGYCNGVIWKVNSHTFVGAPVDRTGRHGEANHSFIHELVQVPIRIWKLPLASFGKSGTHWVESHYQIPKRDSELQADSGAQYANKFYAMGGVSGTDLSGGHLIIPVKGVSSWNTRDGTGWKNSSTQDFKPHGSTAFGQAIPAPFGAEGIIVYIGGYAPSGPFPFSSDSSPFMDMALINVYDIASGKFLSQKATGDIPEHRWSFCAAGVSEQGSGTFDIFVFGGHHDLVLGEPSFLSLRQVYVLSLPSFTWIKVPGVVEMERAATTCQVVGNRQMAVIGGYNPTTTDIATPDPWTNSIKLFDMSTWEWKDVFDAKAPAYKRAQKLVTSTENQGYPDRWDSAKVKALFDNGTFTDQQPSMSSESNIGAIIGGVVGGIACVGLILGIIIYWYSRRSKATKEKQESRESRDEEHLTNRPNGSNLSNRQELEHKVAELGPALAFELESAEKSIEMSAKDESPPTSLKELEG